MCVCVCALFMLCTCALHLKVPPPPRSLSLSYSKVDVHVECFACNLCGKSLFATPSFVEKDGEFLCPPHGNFKVIIPLCPRTNQNPAEDENTQKFIVFS